MAKAVLGLVALAGVLFAIGVAPAAAQERDGAAGQYTAERRPHITIHPRARRLSPNAERHCTAWLRVEHRPSGTVLTPQKRCWWVD